MGSCADLTDDELADGITTWAARIAAGEAQLIDLLAEFDRREAWGGAGLLSCAHWLSWRTGLGLTAARERVRVARALRDLPEVRAAFAAGRMSWSQVRAVTRVATPGDECTYVELARHTTGSQLERVVRGVRRAQRLAEDAADPELAAQRMHVTSRYDADGTLVTTIRSRAVDGAVVLAALRAAQADLERELAAEAELRSPAAPDGSQRLAADILVISSAATGTSSVPLGGRDTPGAQPPESSAEAPCRPRPTLADALLRIAHDSLGRQQEQRPVTARRYRARLAVHVDPLSGWGRLPDGEFLPPHDIRGVLRQMTGPARPRQCSLIRHRPLNSADVQAAPDPVSLGGAVIPLALTDQELTDQELTDPELTDLALSDLALSDLALTDLDLGRSQREPSLRLRERLSVVDGERCRFPGCTRHRLLHAHHARFWSRGGRTDLANLVLLCSRHHTLVHRDRFDLVLHPDRRLTVSTTDGRPVPHHPDRPRRDPAELDPYRRLTATTLPPDTVQARIDLGYVVSVIAQQAA